MFQTTLANVAQKRTIRPLYAQHQSTSYGGFLDPNWAKTTDIYPGMVITKLQGETFTLCKGDGVQKPFGLAALFVAPQLGIDETQLSGINLFTVWVGDGQAVFEVLAPAFDTSASWTMPTTGARVMLGCTNATHTQGIGKLSPVGTANVDTTPVAELIDVVGTQKIVVRLNRLA